MSLLKSGRDDGVDDKVEGELRGTEKVKDRKHYRVVEAVFGKWKTEGKSILETEREAANRIHKDHCKCQVSSLDPLFL